MVTWILECIGVMTAAYFAAAVIGTLNFEEVIYASSDHSHRLHNKFKRVFFISLFTIEGLVLVFIDVHSKTHNRPHLGTIWLIAVIAATFAFFIPGPVVVTSEGLSRHRNLRRDVFIPWDDLDHYEICKGEWGIMGLGVSDVYYLRMIDGRTLKVNEWSQDAGTLLGKIATYRKIQELPFHR